MAQRYHQPPNNTNITTFVKAQLILTATHVYRISEAMGVIIGIECTYNRKLSLTQQQQITIDPYYIE